MNVVKSIVRIPIEASTTHKAARFRLKLMIMSPAVRLCLQPTATVITYLVQVNHTPGHPFPHSTNSIRLCNYHRIRQMGRWPNVIIDGRSGPHMITYVQCGICCESKFRQCRLIRHLYLMSSIKLDCTCTLFSIFYVWLNR